MRCINKKRFLIALSVVLILGVTGCGGKKSALNYELEHYNTSIHEEELYSSDLCVSLEDVELKAYKGDSTLHAAALFDLKNKEVLYSQNLHDKIFPASTTKILTALVALNEKDISETVTISKAAAASSFQLDEQVCGLNEGDKLTLEDLLYGLLLHSGNDAAVAVAEFVGGDVETFAEMMNEQANALCSTNTHFTSPNGLHDDEHYTSAYDMYLIFNECIKHQEFLDIISASYREASIEGKDGDTRKVTWYPTSYYAKGLAALPENATILGGKTGYTGEAGNCLILLEYDESDNPYISIVMGAETKDLLYEDMTELIEQIPTTK